MEGLRDGGTEGSRERGRGGFATKPQSHKGQNMDLELMLSCRIKTCGRRVVS